MEFLWWMWTWSLLKRSPGGSQVRWCPTNLLSAPPWLGARITAVLKRFLGGGLFTCSFYLFTLLACFSLLAFSRVPKHLGSAVVDSPGSCALERPGATFHKYICIYFIFPPPTLFGSHVGVGVSSQERISQITLTTALTRTPGKLIVRSRRGCGWAWRCLQSARWPARSL